MNYFSVIGQNKEINSIASTSDCIDVNEMLYKRHVLAGYRPTSDVGKALLMNTHTTYSSMKDIKHISTVNPRYNDSKR